jgi:[protein-PII] uridylyltransferase
MYLLQSPMIRARPAVAEPLDGCRPLSNTSVLRGFHDEAAPMESVRHVLRAIASDPREALDRERWLARARPLVDRSHAMLRARFEDHGSVEGFLRGRTRLADGAVVGLLHLARAVVRSDHVVTAIAPVTIVAVGGYGRRELAPASDLDLLFLLDDAAGRTHAERLIGFVLAGLWDLGFEVGHASRTLAACEELATVEPTVLASLLDARFLAGSFGLYGRLDSTVRRLAKDVGAKALTAALAPRLSASIEGDQAARDEEEPDVKRGQGALRDVQHLLWRARLDHADADPGAAAVPAIVSDARHFLWQVRCHLHLLAGRAQDRLVREIQLLVARRLGLPHGPDTGATALMDRHRGYTRAVRALLTAP